jgi:sulfate permease, SulP family
VHEAVPGSPSPVRWLVLDAAAITHVDAADVAALHDLTAELAAQGIATAIARLTSPMREHFDETGLPAAIGASRFHPTVGAAVRACAPPPRPRDAVGSRSPPFG